MLINYLLCKNGWEGRSTSSQSSTLPGTAPFPKSLTARVQRPRSSGSMPEPGALTQLWTCWPRTEDSLLPPPWLSGGQVSGWLPLLLLVHPKRHMGSLFTKHKLGLGALPLTLLLIRGTLEIFMKRLGWASTNQSRGPWIGTEVQWTPSVC